MAKKNKKKTPLPKEELKSSAGSTDDVMRTSPSLVMM